MAKPEFTITLDVKHVLKKQAEKIRQLTAERDAARAQVDRDGPRLYALARELDEATADGRKWHRIAVARGDRLDKMADEIGAEVTLVNRQVEEIAELKRRVEGLTALNTRLNADLDEVCEELARSKEEIAVLREELGDLHRRGSDHG